MPEFKKGQRVHVQFDGEVVRGNGDTNYVTVKAGPFFGLPYDTNIQVHFEKVTLLDPPDWPPRVGDIWEANGQEWFACRRHDDWEILVKPDDGGGLWDTRTFKGLNPVLVRRRGQ